jgi:YVTN family beta-propeller protein
LFVWIFILIRPVSIIDTNTNTVIGNPIPVGDGPNGVTYDPVNQRMYVANLFGNTVSAIDTNTNLVVGNPISVGTRPVLMSYDQDHGRIYVSNRGTNTVSVIQITTSQATINTVIDGNNAPVMNGGSTSSNIITFALSSN